MTEQPFLPNRPVRPEETSGLGFATGEEVSLTDTVDISLDVRLESSIGTSVRNIVIDNHVDLRDVDASGDDVGSDEHLGLSVSEAIENVITVTIHLFAVKCGDRVTFGRESVGDSVCGISTLRWSTQLGFWNTCQLARAHLAKDNALSDGHAVVEGREGLVFLVFAIAFEVQLLDRFHGDFLLAKEDRVGFGSERLGEGLDFWWESCGEEHQLHRLGERSAAERSA